MKKSIAISVLILVLVLTLTTSVFADLPGSGWWSAVFVQNISENESLLEITAFDSASDLEYEASAHFDPGTALVYDPGKTPGGIYLGFSPALPTGFQGSVVLSSSEAAAAVSEIANYRNGPVGGSGTASARYTGMSAADIDTTLFVPSIKHNYVGHTTTLYVQAAGQPANVTVTYNMNDGGVYTQEDIQIDANKMFVFDPANALVPSTGCGTDANTSQCAGSAVVTSSTGPIAGTVVEHQHVGSPASYVMSTRMQTQADMDTILYHPNVKNDYMGIMVAGASVMNVGSEPALVQITLTVTMSSTNRARPGDVFEYTAVIEPNQGYLFSKWNNNLGGMPAGTFAAAVVESLDTPDYNPQPLIGSTNDSKIMPKIRAGRGITLYAAFADQSSTDSVAAPIIRENINGISGGLTVQNVGTGPDIIDFWYHEYGTDNVYHFWTTSPIGDGEATNTGRVALNAGGRFTNDGTWSFSALNNNEFSVVARSRNGQPIIGLASEYAMADNMDIRNYEAINFGD